MPDTQALKVAGQSFSPDGRHGGITPLLGRFLRDAGCRNIRHLASILAPQPDMLMVFAARTQGARAYLQENTPVSLIRQIAELPQGIFLTDPAVSAQVADYLAHHLLFSINDEKLTPREREVFHLLLNGQSKRDIAERLHISVNTIKAHVRSIYDKLKLNRYRMEIRSILHDPDTKNQ